MDAVEFKNMVTADAKAFYENPRTKVLDDPKKTLTYSVAIKTIGYFVALVSPFIGYAIVTSSFLIDFHIVVNYRDFKTSLTIQSNLEHVEELFRSWGNFFSRADSNQGQ